MAIIRNASGSDDLLSDDSNADEIDYPEESSADGSGDEGGYGYGANESGDDVDSDGEYGGRRPASGRRSNEFAGTFGQLCRCTLTKACALHGGSTKRTTGDSSGAFSGYTSYGGYRGGNNDAMDSSDDDAY